VSSAGLESLAGLTRARHRGNVAPSNSKLTEVNRTRLDGASELDSGAWVTPQRGLLMPLLFNTS